MKKEYDVIVFGAGTAGGAMAALSAAEGIDPADLPHEKLTTTLGKHNAIVPE